MISPRFHTGGRGRVGGGMVVVVVVVMRALCMPSRWPPVQRKLTGAKLVV